jgi:hypothetical protein
LPIVCELKMNIFAAEEVKNVETLSSLPNIRRTRPLDMSGSMPSLSG